MGSNGSKTASSSVNGGGGRKGRLKARSRVFKSSCLGTFSSGSRDSDSDEPVCDIRSKENGNDASFTNQTDVDSDQCVQRKIECFRKLKDEQSVSVPSISSNVERNEWGQASKTEPASRTGSSSVRGSSTQSLNPPSRFLSRFSLIPGNVSFRLSRATSLGSSRAYPAPSSSHSMLNDEEESSLHSIHASGSGFAHTNESHHNSDLGPVAQQIHRSPIHYDEDNMELNTSISHSSDVMQGSRTVSSISSAAIEGTGNRVGVDVNLHPPRILNDLESIETRLSDRRTGVREPVEHNVRFSRTLSVGRLRDRVLRRSSLPDFTGSPTPMQQERETRDPILPSRRQFFGSETLVSAGTSVSPPVTGYHSSNVSSSLINIQDEVETSRSRDTRYHDLLEHRSNFLERRRRIRSQVHALQRLGGRFENFSGHERSCILSGQHRTGRCTCRVSNRNANLNDETTASASISRIVILAEALFEVLDEIHQQSVVLSSRPSVSSIGSVPAPNETVESLPLKTYTKSLKHQTEDDAQCYICLVEYDEGDCMRILPCHHEFHRTCIDKWLKEIHRVCPLCRGDICRSDSLPVEN